MTAHETALIVELRKELHTYHVEVKQHIQRCEDCRMDVVQLAKDMYGLPGEKERSPGLMGDVSDLKRSRQLMVLALRGAWVLLTILLGAVATSVLRVSL